MIIIQCSYMVDPKEMTRLWDELDEQARKGLILLPHYCSLAAVTGKDNEIVFFYREKYDD